MQKDEGRCQVQHLGLRATSSQGPTPQNTHVCKRGTSSGTPPEKGAGVTLPAFPPDFVKLGDRQQEKAWAGKHCRGPGAAGERAGVAP